MIGHLSTLSGAGLWRVGHSIERMDMMLLLADQVPADSDVLGLWGATESAIYAALDKGAK